MHGSVGNSPGRRVSVVGIAFLICASQFVGCGFTRTSSSRGTAQGQLSLSVSSLNFGNVAVGLSNSMTVLLTNRGNADLTISQVSATGSEFTASGVGAFTMLTPGQTTLLTVTFSPAAVGNATGSITLTSDAMNSPSDVSLTGSGVGGHFVTLTWNPSSSAVIGYNIYRSEQSGTGYVRLNSAFVPNTSYTDASVAGGHTYYYVATSVDLSNNESAFSNQVSVTIPSP